MRTRGSILARALPIDAGGQGGGRTMRALARSAGSRFTVRDAKDDAPAVIELYDEIGYWGTTAKQFAQALKGKGDIVLKVNSPGGDVFDGIAMYNDLVAHKGKVRVEVTGLAASAASVVAMAGDEIAIGTNAFMMIHNAWTIMIGDRHEMRDIADTLEQIDGALARTYAQVTGKGVQAIEELMDAETWLDGATAVAEGFATEIIAAPTASEESAAARFDLSIFDRAPAQLVAQAADIQVTTIRDAERVLREAHFSRSQIARLVAAIKSEAPRDAGSGQAAQRDAGIDLTGIARAIGSWSPRA